MATKTLKTVSGVVLGMALGFGVVPTALGFEIAIEVAPNVLNLQSEGYVVTVHTDIAYWDVYAYSVQLNGVPIHAWKADNQGFFVAKFLMSEIKLLDGLRSGGDNELLLIGTTDGEVQESFWGEDTVSVVDKVPVKAGR